MQPALADEPLDGLARELRESHAIHLLNLRLRQLGAAGEATDAIPFLCECSDPSCYAVLWFSAGAFDRSAAEEPGWLLRPEHAASAPWPPPPASSQPVRRPPRPTKARLIHRLRAGRRLGRRRPSGQRPSPR
jgi:hypothetical protein